MISSRRLCYLLREGAVLGIVVAYVLATILSPV